MVGGIFEGKHWSKQCHTNYEEDPAHWEPEAQSEPSRLDRFGGLIRLEFGKERHRRTLGSITE